MENRRAWVLASADLRTNGEVAAALGLSVRQVQRLKKALREAGPAGLAHGNRGRSVAHTLPEELAGRVVALYKDQYPGFNFSHFHEKLVEDEGLTVSRSSVGRILKAAWQVSAKKRRAAKHRSRRERRASEGAMLQIDGSPHDWLEGRGPRLCLLGAIDDATGKVPGALFREHEDAQGYFLLMRGIVRKQGIHETVYRGTAYSSGMPGKRSRSSSNSKAGARPRSLGGCWRNWGSGRSLHTLLRPRAE
ncbi:MAG: helix-turn-helix domain containing protein [Planctomycetes bacterium]|nr:helix-turn-helix domain containing protein [Planctomycetota bacterium]